MKIEIKDMPEIATEIIHKAFYGKTDLAGYSYYAHCIRVEKGCYSEYKGCVFIDPEISTIALLHDLLEDCEEWNDIVLSYFFTDRIVEGVISLTKLKNESYNAYIDRLSKNKDAIKVKLSDLRDNMDITRFKLPLEQKDIDRLCKYQHAYLFLTNI
jgi:(p)ppGpp synthase/HD superfamily hydrolase